MLDVFFKLNDSKILLYSPLVILDTLQMANRRGQDKLLKSWILHQPHFWL